MLALQGNDGGEQAQESEKTMSIVEDLRKNPSNYFELAAASMIEFLLSRMVQKHTHLGSYWEFENSGFPMDHCVGETAEEAVWNAIEQRKLSR